MSRLLAAVRDAMANSTARQGQFFLLSELIKKPGIAPGFLIGMNQLMIAIISIAD